MIIAKIQHFLRKLSFPFIKRTSEKKCGVLEKIVKFHFIHNIL